jgi:lipopolysaccharide O-acetyltransferase
MRFKGYSIPMLIWLFICRIATFFILPKARLIRLPFIFRKQGKVIGGKNFTTGFFNRVDVFQNAVLQLGENIQINDHCHIACAESIEIGDDTLIASRVFITDHDHVVNNLGEKPNNCMLNTSKVKIGKRVWLGEGVSILKGVHIGDDVTIGTNSVVTKDIPAGSIAVGVPAKVIKTR